MDKCWCRDGIDSSQGQGVGGVPLTLKGCSQTLEDQVVPPGVPTLCEARHRPAQDVLESRWSWTEGTGWILATPLVGVFWRWDHIIGSSDDEADVVSLHFLELPLAEHSPLQAFPIHPLSPFGKRDGLWLLSASSRLRTSSTTIFLLSDVKALCEVGLLPSWTRSLCLRAAVACCTASDGVHFPPIDRSGAALLMVLFLESFKVIWNLAFEQLYSSVRLVIASSRTPMP